MKYTASLLLALLFISHSHAQWTKINSPKNATIKAFERQGDLMYMVSVQNVYKSIDQGNTWSAANTGIPTSSLALYSIEAINDLLYLGTSKGIYKSADSAKTWVSMSNGMPSFNFIERVRAHKNNIYAGSNHGFLTYDFGVQKWDTINSGLPKYANVNDILVVDSMLIIATSKGLYSSDTNTIFWTQISSGLPTANAYYSLTNVGDTIVAGSLQGVHTSNDRGKNWSQKNNGLDLSFELNVYSNDGLLFAGGNQHLFLSKDQGNNWTKIYSGIKNLQTTNVNAEAVFMMNKKLFFGGVRGLKTSNDTGKTWTVANNDLPVVDLKALEVNGDNIYVGAEEGIFISRDSGSSWEHPFVQPISSLEAYDSIVIFGQPAGQVYSSFDDGKTFKRSNGFNDNSQDVLAAAGKYVLGQTNRSPRPSIFGFVSRDTGQNFNMERMNLTWFTEQNKTTIFGLDSMARKFDGNKWIPQTIAIINESTFSIGVNSTTVIVGIKEGIMRSKLTGSSWDKKIFTEPNAIPYTIVSNDSLWYLTTTSNKVYYSDDDGQSWSNTTENLTDSVIVPGFSGIVGSQIAIGNSHVFYAGRNGIWKRKLHTVQVADTSKDTTNFLIENVQGSFSVFPNPSNGFISVIGENISSILILNSFGQVVLENNYQPSSLINLEELSLGVYTIKMVLNNGHSVTRKLVLE